ncbi:MAG: subtilisin family serine protease [Saprospiraceae bacterium]|jgi:subtilisin family serine protease
MSENIRPILLIRRDPVSEAYTSRNRGNSSPELPERNRAEHTGRLRNQFTEIEGNRQSMEAVQSKDGIYLQFSGQTGHDLATRSLENLPKKIRLLNVKTTDGTVSATVYVPLNSAGFYLTRLDEYAQQESPNGNPKNQKVIESIEDVKEAIIESFWQDSIEAMPAHDSEWIECWLRVDDQIQDEIITFRNTASAFNIDVAKGQIIFPERVVVSIKANREQLTNLIYASNQIAEFRQKRELAGFWLNETNIEQAEWIQDLLAKTEIAETNTSILLLDTGINRAHPLIENLLKTQNLFTYDDEWGVNDHDGHGTKMAGISIYGDLSNAFDDNQPFAVNHKLESGKILPPVGANPKELYGYITQQVISEAEIKNPEFQRIICLATSEEIDDHDFLGRPTSWSGAIDSLASGAMDDKKRLIVIAAGNLSDPGSNYVEENILSEIESPGQSWNALTIGAYTDLTLINDDDLEDYEPIANGGELSPYSRTSRNWENSWAIKPDVLFEGGNVAIDSTGFITSPDDLSLLTTSHQPTLGLLTSFSATSAAAAQASRMAAIIALEYPEFWPETIRGLIVHSAKWSQAMEDQFLEDASRRSYLRLLRACGYGIPNIQNAISCANNSLTLVAQNEIQPFIRKEGKSYYSTNEMHFFDLPWPLEALLELENTPVKLRATLSYFIEPGPGEIGWKERYRYPSHGLRFDINNPTETPEQFLNRINANIDIEGEGFNNNANRWKIGTNNRRHGSIHSDIIETTGAELATSKFIGVYPTIGWWKERSHLGKGEKSCRYSLIISIETPETNIDLYNIVREMVEEQIVITT